MIYLHCGWPKTGTTSLQASLLTNRALLAKAGIVYPDRWHRMADCSHNELEDFVKGSAGSDEDFDDVKGFLRTHPGEDTLLSSESLTVCVLREDATYESLLRLIGAAQEVSPVRCIWTLRRFDHVIQSFCQEAISRGRDPASLTEWLMKNLQLGEMFPRMLGIEDRVAADAGYLKYDSSGVHNMELLRAVGTPPELASQLGAGARRRLNVSRSHKELVALAHLEAISARMGIEVDRDALLRAFDEEGFRFEDDGDCDVLGPGMRHDLHEEMLRSARDCGFEPYLRFFGDEPFVDPQPASSIDPDVLGEADLSSLRTHLLPTGRAGS